MENLIKNLFVCFYFLQIIDVPYCIDVMKKVDAVKMCKFFDEFISELLLFVATNPKKKSYFFSQDSSL